MSGQNSNTGKNKEMNVEHVDEEAMKDLLKRVGNPIFCYTDVQVTDRSLEVNGEDVGTADGTSDSQGTKNNSELLTGKAKSASFKEMLPPILSGVTIKLKGKDKDKNKEKTDKSKTTKPRKPKTAESRDEI